MVRQDNARIDESIENGRANQRLLPRVKRWCRHIDVEMTSSGLLAQMTGLMIGRLKVICPHGHTPGESAHLSLEANSFILSNCVDCPHHDEISSDNYGREILAEKTRQELDQKEVKTRLHQLKAEAHESAARALKTGRPTEASVNRFILDLFGSDEQAVQSKDLLVQAAHLGPECFSDAALTVLSDALKGPYASPSAEAARIICRYRKTVPDCLAAAALEAAAQGCDAACGLLVDSIGYGQDATLILADLATIVNLPNYAWYHSTFQADDEPPKFPSTLELITKLAAIDHNTVRAILVERLRNSQKIVRVNTISLMTDLLARDAKIILPLATELLNSLELPDDVYCGCSADSEACQLLSNLYIQFPDTVEVMIQTFLRMASQDARILVLDVYSRLALGCIHEESPRRATRRGVPAVDPARCTSYASMAIEQHLLVLGDLNISPRSRHEVCEDLKRLITHFPEVGLTRIERILGRLAMTVRESQNTPQSRIESFEWEFAYTALNRTLTKIVKKLIDFNPQFVFDILLKLLNRLTSTDQADAKLKAQLVTTLPSFASTYELVPLVIRQLYKHLVDFESIAIRVSAIRAAGELLSDIEVRESMPDDIIELLTIYMNEDYIVIHKSATRALSALRFQRDERGNNVLSRLVVLEQYYRVQATDFDFVRDVFDILMWSFKGWPDVELYVVRKLLPNYVISPDPRFAEEMLVQMSEQNEHFPELASTFLCAAIDYLKVTDRDRYNDDTYSERRKILNQLTMLPATVLGTQIDKIGELIRSKVGHDPIDVIQLLEILSLREMHSEAASLAQEALQLVPEVKARTFERHTYASVHAAELVESLVITGDFQKALQIIESAKTNHSKPFLDQSP